MLLEGQVHGGIVQGIGQALYEETIYDEHGQLLSGSFMDYAIPRASDVPNLIFLINEILCKNNLIRELKGLEKLELSEHLLLFN